MMNKLLVSDSPASQRPSRLAHSPRPSKGRVDTLCLQSNGDAADDANACGTTVHYASGMRRIVYIALAGVFFVFAMIGVVLPGIPTTPFLLLTSYFLARSWPRMHRALRANRWVGPIILQWEEHRAIERRVKVRAAATIGLVIALMAVFSGWPAYRILCVAAFSCVGLVVIYKLPTLERAS